MRIIQVTDESTEEMSELCERALNALGRLMTKIEEMNDNAEEEMSFRSRDSWKPTGTIRTRHGDDMEYRRGRAGRYI